jgi:YVTN family beta-propeller protein
MSASRLWNCAAVLALAAGAILFASGCNFDPFAIAVGYNPEIRVKGYVVECEPQSMTLQLYELQRNEDTSSPWDPDQRVPLDSPINGKPCSQSTDLQNRPFSLGQALNAGLLASASFQSSAKADASPASGSSLIDTFPTLIPLLFSPIFPATDAAKATRSCPPTLHSYLVNHTQGTVTSFQVCPLATKTEISVQSNPLQLAVTPDGSTLLVTSYDSAVTFIDTSTDKVTFVLPTPGYYPQGIAITPDGTRAYVTDYDLVNQRLLVIDIPNRKLLPAIPLPTAYPRVVAITPDGSQAWVNYWQSSYITIVDLLSQTVAETLNFGAPISQGMVFNPQGTKALVLADPGLVLVIDTATLTQMAQIPVGPYPSDIVLGPEGEAFVNSSTQDGIWVVNWVKNKLSAAPQNPTPGGSMGLLVY